MPAAEMPVVEGGGRNGSNPGSRDIAIVGMAAMLPGAADIRRAWQNIVAAKCVLAEVDPARWSPRHLFDSDPRQGDKIYSKWGGFLDEILFDPLAFGIPPKSLKSIEPLQLLALKVAAEAMQNAGYAAGADFDRERTAVIFGMGGVQEMCAAYCFRTMLHHYLPRARGLSDGQRQEIIDKLDPLLPDWTEDSFPGILGNVVAGRIANRLNLGGANYTVDAACASSLAAVEIGMHKLRSGEAETVLVGAADTANNAFGFTAFSKTMVLSPRGKSRPFDDSADGIVISEGVAALVLKRLGDAQHQGDRIHAIIKGIGSASDGKHRSLTAPHSQGQLRALNRAYANAGIAPRTLELIEAHATGTVVGDRSEIEALKLAFGNVSDGQPYCALGSVKSNIGHTKTTAGLAGIIKACQALRHKTLPPTIGVETPNSRVDLSRTAFYINSEARPWFASNSGHPRRCGVSAFGFGGTNFHLVLEELAEPGGKNENPLPNYHPRGAEIFAFASDTRQALTQKLTRLVRKLEGVEGIDLAQLAHAVHREHAAGSLQTPTGVCRLAIVARSIADLVAKLDTCSQNLQNAGTSVESAGVYYHENDSACGRICFLFPGQGSQRINMLRGLLLAFPELHQGFENANRILADRLDLPLTSYIYPLPVYSDDQRQRQQKRLNLTRVAQPALAAADMAAFDLLGKFNIRPDMTAGHSFGEYAALCAAGVFSAPDLIDLAEVRGRCMDDLAQKTPGGMAAVQADAATTAAEIDRSGLTVSIANLNAPDQTVISGDVQAVEDMVAGLSRQGVAARKIPVSAAFHSAAMAPAQTVMSAALNAVSFRPANRPVFSNLTGRKYPAAPNAMREMLVRHIAEPVQFERQIENIYDQGARIFIEAGPGRILGTLTDRILADKPHTTLCLAADGGEGCLQLADLLGRTVTAGLPVDLTPWFQGRGLAPLGIDALLHAARERMNPAPPLWRFKNGRMTPCQRTQKTTPSQANRPADLRIPVAAKEPTDDNNEGFEHMKKVSPESRISQDPQHAATGRHPSLLARIQDNTRQFIVLQREQQRLMDRFLGLQERCLNMAGQDAPPMADLNLDSHPVPTPQTDLAVPDGGGIPESEFVPPVPVLPDLTVGLGSGDPPAGFGEAPDFAESSPQQPVGTEEAAPPTPAVPMEFKSDLLKITSQHTGYPIEMLDLDAHLEADLGIDSIKIVEIFNQLKDHNQWLETSPESSVMEELADLTTLGKIITWYENNRQRSHSGGEDISKKV